MYYVSLLDDQGRRYEMSVAEHGKSGFPIDELEQYQHQNLIGDVTHIIWNLPKYYCCPIHSGRFWRGRTFILYGYDRALEMPTDALFHTISTGSAPGVGILPIQDVGRLCMISFTYGGRSQTKVITADPNPDNLAQAIMQENGVGWNGYSISYM